VPRKVFGMPQGGLTCPVRSLKCLEHRRAYVPRKVFEVPRGGIFPSRYRRNTAHVVPHDDSSFCPNTKTAFTASSLKERQLHRSKTTTYFPLPKPTTAFIVPTQRQHFLIHASKQRQLLSFRDELNAADWNEFNSVSAVSSIDPCHWRFADVNMVQTTETTSRLLYRPTWMAIGRRYNSNYLD
jgi:hypothetical protein